MRSGVSGIGVRRLSNGCDDAEVGATAADIAVHMAYDFLARGIGRFDEQRYAGDDHAGSAVATLHGAFSQESILERVMNPFNGGDAFPGGSAHGEDAGAG